MCHVLEGPRSATLPMLFLVANVGDIFGKKRVVSLFHSPQWALWYNMRGRCNTIGILKDEETSQILMQENFIEAKELKGMRKKSKGSSVKCK